MLTGQFLEQQAGIVGTIFIFLSRFRIGKRCQHAMAQYIQLKWLKRNEVNHITAAGGLNRFRSMMFSTVMPKSVNTINNITFLCVFFQRSEEQSLGAKRIILNLSHTWQRLDWLMTPEEEERNRKSFILRMTLGCARYKCTKNCAVNHLDHLAKNARKMWEF